MRLFQNSGVYPAYLSEFTRRVSSQASFVDRRAAFLRERFGALHMLAPVLAGDPQSFFTNGDDEILQRAWARENGLSADAGLDDILLAQIEHHRTEVFYNLDPMRFQSEFLRRLPGTVKRTIAWRAAPSPRADFSRYDLLVCNFPSLLEGYRKQGWRAAYFAPAYDPVMDEYGDRSERPVDVVFVGGYTRHHQRRAVILNAAAELQGRISIRMHLDSSRATRIAESALGRLLPLEKYRRPAPIRKLAQPPVFGRDLYETLASAKIVLNAAIDMAGEDRGNMRCFEAMGCGSLMMSDRGAYPEGMEHGRTIYLYENASTLQAEILRVLENFPTYESVARRGREVIRTQYDKARQWRSFCELTDGAATVERA